MFLSFRYHSVLTHTTTTFFCVLTDKWTQLNIYRNATMSGKSDTVLFITILHIAHNKVAYHNYAKNKK